VRRDALRVVGLGERGIGHEDQLGAAQGFSDFY